MRYQRRPFPASAIECTCLTCGHTFGISPSDLADQNFCSRPCYWRWHSVERPCLWCGTVLHATNSQVRRGRTNFCDKGCYVPWAAKRARERLAERFWSHVLCITGTRCWEWQGSRVWGYGQLSTVGGGSPLKASRVAWELEHGPIPDGLLVCHRCDNPPCVNPSHLFLGTDADNMRDMITKGRAHHPYTISHDQLVEIRARYLAGGVSQQELAAEYGVQHQQISRIVLYQRRRS